MARSESTQRAARRGRQARAPHYRLSAQVAFRARLELALVVDQARGEILELNRAAARVLEALDQGSPALSTTERRFAEQLVRHGLARRLGARRAEDAAGRPRNAVPPVEPDRDLLDEINRRAEAACVPLHAQIELTYRCGLGCKYCYLEPRTATSAAELTTLEITRLLDELASMGTLFLLLTGGEPFARSDLEHIVRHARHRRFAVSLLTSGWGMNRALAARLARRGLDAVQVTIHGHDAATHEAMTGVSGSFAAAVDALRCWRDLGVRTQAAVTLTRRNHRQLPAMLDLLERERLGLNLSCYVQPRRDGRRDTQRLLLGEARLRAVLARSPAGAAPRLANRELDAHPCGAGACAVAVDPHGTVYPCHGLRLPAGSIRSSSLREIWRSSAVLARVRRIRVRDLADCPDCAWRLSCNRCAGSAVAEGLSLTDHCAFDCVQARTRAALYGAPSGGRV
jgi:pyrroloquinoline quinone biosynthesis protein E